MAIANDNYPQGVFEVYQKEINELQAENKLLKEHTQKLEMQLGLCKDRFKVENMQAENKKLEADRDAHSKVRQRHLVRLGKCSEKIKQLQKDLKETIEFHDVHYQAGRELREKEFKELQAKYKKLKEKASKSDLDRVIREYGVNNIDHTKKYQLGHRLILPDGQTFQYVKIDFGIVGKMKNDGGEMRHIEYRWIRVPL